MDFTANIAFLFPDLPFLDRIDAAKKAGFDKVECHFPYEFPIEVLRERLDRAGVALTGLTLLLEPLNRRDAPGYLVSRSDDLAGIIAGIGAPNVKLLFDVYHVQIMEGDLIRRMEKHRAVIGHVQVAGVPDRAEPDEDNEINYAAIFRALERIGYGGLVGLEYKPRGDTVAGLKWMR